MMVAFCVRPSWATGEKGVVFNKDGARVYVESMVARETQVLSFEGRRLTTLGRRIRVDGGPLALHAADL